MTAPLRVSLVQHDTAWEDPAANRHALAAMTVGAPTGGDMCRGTPRKGAIRSMVRPTAGAATQPPVRMPPLGSSIRISTK